MQTVFICSPYRGNIDANVLRAKAMCLLAVEKGLAPFAPHLFYTQFLDDDHPEGRMAGISCGLAFINACDLFWFLDGIDPTIGMVAEMTHAKRMGKYVEAIQIDWIER
jgi:hypothetical protein